MQWQQKVHAGRDGRHVGLPGETLVRSDGSPMGSMPSCYQQALLWHCETHDANGAAACQQRMNTRSARGVSPTKGDWEHHESRNGSGADRTNCQL